MTKKYPLTIKEVGMLWIIRNLTLEEVFIFDILALEKNLGKLDLQSFPDWGKKTITKIRRRINISCVDTITFHTKLPLEKLEEYYIQLYDMAFTGKPPISKWSIQQFKTRYNLNKIILKGSEIMREKNRC